MGKYKKEYKYVVVGGCSFTASDWPNLVNPGETFGDIVADYVGASVPIAPEYVVNNRFHEVDFTKLKSSTRKKIDKFWLEHELHSYGPAYLAYGSKCYNLSRSGMSFHYINRKILRWCSRNTDKLSDTLIIIGLTDMARSEFWSNYANRFCGFSPSDPAWGDRNLDHYGVGVKNRRQFDTQLRHHHSDDEIFNWETGSAKKWFFNCYNDNAAFFYNINRILGLQFVFESNGIDYIFFDSVTLGYTYDTFWDKYCADQEGHQESRHITSDIFGHKSIWDNLVSKKNWYKNPKWDSFVELTTSEIEMRISGDDLHPNKKGHKYWADGLIEFMEIN